MAQQTEVFLCLCLCHQITFSSPCKSYIWEVRKCCKRLKLKTKPKKEPYIYCSFVSQAGFFLLLFSICKWLSSIWCKRGACSPSLKKVPQSNFLSTVIFNFGFVSFFGIYCHFIKICSSHWVSATKETLFGHKNSKKNTPRTELEIYIYMYFQKSYTTKIQQLLSKKIQEIFFVLRTKKQHL